MAMVLPPGPCGLPTIKPLIICINKMAEPFCTSVGGCRIEVQSCLNERPLVVDVYYKDSPISSERNV